MISLGLRYFEQLAPEEQIRSIFDYGPKKLFGQLPIRRHVVGAYYNFLNRIHRLHFLIDFLYMCLRGEISKFIPLIYLFEPRCEKIGLRDF